MKKINRLIKKMNGVAMTITMAMVAMLMIPTVSVKAQKLSYPEHRRDSILKQITGAQKPQKKVNILDYGAIGNGKTNCKPAFDKAIAAAKRGNGIHIVVPRGTYYIQGPLKLASNVCIELQREATLRFSSDPKHYLPLVSTSWEGTFLKNYCPFIYANGVYNVSIIGRGTIDGNAASTFAKWKNDQKPSQELTRWMNRDATALAERNFGPGKWLRPQLIQFYSCKNITLQGITIKNSPFWCVHLLKTENVICRGLHYDAKNANNDGIDPEYSRNILIEDVHFNNADDNIAIKSGRGLDGWNTKMPSENIVIRKCHFKGLHGVVIGSEMSAGVRNVFVEDCDNEGYCKRGIYLKTNADRGGFIENIYVRNVKFGDVEDLIYATSKYANEGKEGKHPSVVKNIYMENVTCKSSTKGGIVLQGSEKSPITNAWFNGIDAPGATMVSFDFTENVSLNNCHLGAAAGVPTMASDKDDIFGKEQAKNE